MTKPNKPYDTTPRLDPSIKGLYPSPYVYLTAYISLILNVVFLTQKCQRIEFFTCFVVFM